MAIKKNKLPFVAAWGCCLLLSGCAEMAAQQTAIAGMQSSIDEMQAEVAQTQAAMDTAAQTAAAQDSLVNDNLQQVSARLEQLDSTIAAACKAVSVPQPQAPAAECPQLAEPVVMAENEKLLLGEVESVTVVDPQFHITARMDTGASSSSLHAKNLVEFERDGDAWVRFDVEHQDSDIAITMERPVQRYVRVFQQADKEGSRRPVVELRISLGNVQSVFEFTLADRSHLEHSMILGRNFLTDIAVVDVSQQFLQPNNTRD